MKTSAATKTVKKVLTTAGAGQYVLRLYVAGATTRSRQALLRVRRFCETALQGEYDLQVIDIYQHPISAREGQVLATPMLVREFPLPMRRLIGDLTNTKGMLVGMELGPEVRTAP